MVSGNVFPSLNYRRKDQQFIKKAIGSGESCHLVAPSGIGKSNLLQMIERKDFRQEHFGNAGDMHLVVSLNPHNFIFLEPSGLAIAGKSWAGYELMLKELMEVIRPIADRFEQPKPIGSEDDEDEETVMEALEANYQRLLKGNEIAMQAAVRFLEDSIRAVLRSKTGTWRLIFVFDEFEQFFDSNVLPMAFFQSLRGMRDEFKKQLMFMTVSRYTLEELSERLPKDGKDRATAESFIELSNDSVHYLRPLDFESASEAMDDMGRRYGTMLRGGLRDQLWRCTGGHPAMMRHGYRKIAELSSEYSYTDDVISDMLAKHPSVLRDISSLMDSLPTAQSKLLVSLACGTSPATPDHNAALTQLILKGLVEAPRDGRESGYKVTIPVLTHVYRAAK